MRKIHIIFTIALLLIISILACKKEEQSLLQASWTSKDPISIPLNNRKHQLELENLAPNPSFESGKLFYEKSNLKTFDIDGWKKIGNNIEWVNKQNVDYNSFEVFDGNHSVKIHREIADETEKTGEGIMSDFIKVIPGNYSLKLFLKLENIHSYMDRLGVKMYDAVNIRLKYYDKNKIEIEAKEFNPFTQKHIDNTFKSLSFANYWNIDNLDWCEIHGKTASFPYFNGDIPDHARYIKIFIGLKGTGTMWIDNIDFRYTDQNFTLLERLTPYFDSSFTAYEKLIPIPKQVIKKESFEFYNPGNRKLPVIVIPNNADKHLITLAKALSVKLQSIIAQTDSVKSNVEIVKNFNINQINDFSFVISIGENPLYNYYKNSLPDTILNDNIDSYYIKSDNEIDNLIFINGQGSESLYNGLYTFNQLLDETKPIFYKADIVDYPDFLQRSFLIHDYKKSEKELKQNLDLFREYKLNVPYFELYQDNLKHYPFSEIQEIAEWENGINLMIKLEATDSLPSENSLSNKIPKSVKSVLISQNINENLLNPDNTVFSKLKNESFYQLEKCINIINRKNKSVNILFAPPFNSLELIDYSKGQSVFYFNNLRNAISRDLSIVWTGDSYCSNSIDYPELNRMYNLIHDYPILLDNSLFTSDLRFKTKNIQNYYAGKIRVLSLFEPYNMNTYNNFYLHNRARKVILNINSLSESGTLRVLTAANYYWNVKDYNPDKTLWIVLNRLYGRETAIKLLKFNDAVFGIKEICRKIESNGLHHKNVRIAKSFKNSLIKYYDLLEKDLDNARMLEEIRTVKADVLEKINNALSDN